MNPAVRQTKRDALLDQEPASETPSPDDRLQLRQRHPSRCDDLPVLAPALHIEAARRMLRPLDAENASAAGSVDRFNVENRILLQHPAEIGG
ncbi:hypothetical protein D3C71_1697990 [compost metagenome]